MGAFNNSASKKLYKLFQKWTNDVNAKFDDNGNLEEVETPLIVAIRHGDDTEKIQKLLIDSGAK